MLLSCSSTCALTWKGRKEYKCVYCVPVAAWMSKQWNHLFLNSGAICPAQLCLTFSVGETNTDLTWLSPGCQQANTDSYCHWQNASQLHLEQDLLHFSQSCCSFNQQRGITWGATGFWIVENPAQASPCPQVNHPVIWLRWLQQEK